MSMGAGAAGVTLLVADQGLRDADGFLMSGQESVATSTYAIVSEDIELHLDDPAGFLPQRIIGDGKVTADAGAGQSVFVGIASTPDVRAYLDGVAYDRLVDLAPGRSRSTGPPRAARPARRRPRRASGRPRAPGPVCSRSSGRCRKGPGPS